MKTIKIRKGLLSCVVLAALWTPLLASAAAMDKHAQNPVWMDWAFFGNTVASACLTRWCNNRDPELLKQSTKED